MLLCLFIQVKSVYSLKRGHIFCIIVLILSACSSFFSESFYSHKTHFSAFSMPSQCKFKNKINSTNWKSFASVTFLSKNHIFRKTHCVTSQDTLFTIVDLYSFNVALYCKCHTNQYSCHVHFKHMMRVHQKWINVNRNCYNLFERSVFLWIAQNEIEMENKKGTEEQNICNDNNSDEMMMMTQY